MKKIIIIFSMMAFMTISAQAVSFTWGSSSPISFGGTTLGTSGAYTAYLFNLSDLSNGTWAGYLSGVVSESKFGTDKVSSSGVRTNGGTNVGKILATDYGLDGNQNNVYGVMVIHEDNDGNIWYNLSGYYVVENIADNVQGAAFNSTFASFSNQTTVDSISKIGTDGWYRITAPVPEPTTAGLAIAGLALLFKRRRK